jgi:hypothetical protein
VNGIDISEMRDATKEERESVDNYIKSISVSTGIFFDEVWNEALRRFEKVSNERH